MSWSWLWTVVAVTFVLLDRSSGEFQLTILHTNDVHSRIEQVNKYGGTCSEKDAVAGKCYGGMARIRTLVDEKRKEYPNSLLLDAGDQFQGTLWYFEFGGLVCSRFMNLVEYNAMAAGNHEFDGGVAGLVPFLQNVTFPVLSSNMDLSGTPSMQGLVRKSVVQTIGGHTIGIIGYTTTDTSRISKPGTVKFKQELQSIQAEVNDLQSQGVNKIIALGHAGYTVDLGLAKALTGVDIIVGGHTNTFLYTGEDLPSNEKPVAGYPTKMTGADGKTVLVVQDYAFGKYLGELHVNFDDDGDILSSWGNPVLLDKDVAQDNETLEIIQEYLPRLDALKKEEVGLSMVHLDDDCRTKECNLGNLLTDALVSQNLRNADSTQWNDVGIAVTNAGGIRMSILPGPITVENVVFVQPFRNTVDIVEITGQTLLDMLEFGAREVVRHGADFGGFLQVSGLKITYDLRRDEGSRVVQVLARCTECTIPRFEPIKPTAVYKILVNNFLVEGGDNYSMLRDNVLKRHILGFLDLDLTLEHIRNFSPIITGVEGRIRFLGEEGTEDFCLDGASHIVHSFSAFVFYTCLILAVIAR